MSGSHECRNATVILDTGRGLDSPRYVDHPGSNLLDPICHVFGCQTTGKDQARVGRQERQYFLGDRPARSARQARHMSVNQDGVSGTAKFIQTGTR